VRSSALLAVRATLLAGPTVLAFAEGGYFRGPRLAAAIAVWVACLVAVLAVPRLRLNAAAVAALCGLALLTGWTALSAQWAPLEGPARDAVERCLLYLGALLAAALALGPRRAARAAEPALVAGILVVCWYGLSDRLLPALVELDRTLSAGGRWTSR
jgi:hypothetical protein